MNTTSTAPRILTGERRIEKAGESTRGRSLVDIILMMPIAALGLVIGAYPLSLPILYLIVISILE